MEKFYGFGRKYVEDYHRKTGRSLFLHLRQIKREVENPKNGPSEDGNVAEPPAEKVYAQVFAIPSNLPNPKIFARLFIQHIMI